MLVTFSLRLSHKRAYLNIWERADITIDGRLWHLTQSNNSLNLYIQLWSEPYFLFFWDWNEFEISSAVSWARAQISWLRHFLGADFSHKIGKIWTNNPTRVISEKLLSNLFRHCPTKIIELHYGSSLGVVYVFWRQHVKGQQFFSDLAAKVWWLPVWAKLGHLGWDAGQALAAGGLTFIIMPCPLGGMLAPFCLLCLWTCPWPQRPSYASYAQTCDQTFFLLQIQHVLFQLHT